MFDSELGKMRFILFTILTVIISSVISQVPALISSEASQAVHNFPKEFSFGASTAAYQIEGGWQDDGKGPSIWDTFTHNHPELIVDHSTADVGPDSYHFYKSDIKALKQVGVNNLPSHMALVIKLFVYRFQFSHSLSIIASQFHGPEFFPTGCKSTRKRLIITTGLSTTSL